MVEEEKHMGKKDTKVNTFTWQKMYQKFTIYYFDNFLFYNRI